MQGKLTLFSIGMFRIGTKVLKELLNNHPEVFYPNAETLFIPNKANKKM